MNKSSAILLQTILTGIKYSFGLEIDDVVITVPASFDSDMRAATLKAAEKAGIKIKNEDGTVRDILLDEPRASLYDFINHQKLGNIGTQIIDFSIPKNILVYDLGGGTLDVSLHRVGYKNPEDNIIDIEDIAISRYLNLGGDVFDETLRDYLYKEYFRRTNLDEKNWGKYELEAIKAKLLVFAENYKISITNRITHRQQYDENVNYLDFSETISSGYLLGTKLLTIDLSMKEYQNLLKHFFAPDISFPTEENINSFKN